MIILPNFSTVHCYPDFQDHQERLASFPNYRRPERIDSIFSREISETQNRDPNDLEWSNATAAVLASDGLFFSHPRLRGLQVTCFSCGNVSDSSVQQVGPFVHLDTCSRSTSPDLPVSAPLMTIGWDRILLKMILFKNLFARDFPHALAQVATLASATAVILLHEKENAQVVPSFY